MNMSRNPGNASSRLWRFLALLLLCVPRIGAAAPIETYGHLPSVEDVTLSPDGMRIAFVRTQGNARIVTIVALADRKPIGVFRVAEQKLRGVSWADDEHLLIYTSTTAVPIGFTGLQHEWLQLQVYDLTNRRTRRVPDDRDMPNNLRIMNVLAGPVMVRQSEGHAELYLHGYYADGRNYPMLLRVDLHTGRQKMIRLGESETRAWLVDRDGEVVAERDYDESSRTWALKIRLADRLSVVASGRDDIDQPAILGFGPTDDTVLVQFPEHGEEVWRLVSLKNGKVGPPMTAGASLSGPIEDPRTNRIIGGYRVEDVAKYVFFDLQMQIRWDAIVHAFDGANVHYVSASRNFRKFVVSVDGPRYGYLYELVDLDAHKALPIGDIYEGLDRPLNVRRITYDAADKLRIPAYLTLPRGRPEIGLPLVVLVHGGPATRDTVDFDWWAQALADMGYAVLQANFRGSTLSNSFLAAGYGEFGRKMQTDLSDGVRYLGQQGIVDPARVCIVGASYGGYAALAGVTLDPGVYRCAVSVAGISDLRRFLQWVNEQHLHESNDEQRYWNRFLGVMGADDPALAALSPMEHVEVITSPVLLVHGRDDTVVPYEQSELMFKALQKAGKDVQFVELQREDHWLSRGETRLQMLHAVADFLRKRNPPD
jgi:dipeptidyl aminopeptidase/acylaminoacyl peptidase